jgi:Uma2 family endonuclease
MTTDQFDVPTIAPEIVVEVLSPDDRRVDVLEKCRVYREASVLLVLVVDPATRTVERFDADGSSQFVDAGTSTVSTIPDFVIPYGDAVFAALDEGFGPDGRIVSRP